ncbi:MAG: NUDIX hydrolase [Methanobacteriaceae archaeon]|nr:NUDIX hydrolase [Methanobacteriaceae archaeon]
MKHPLLTVDTVVTNNESIVLIKRKNDPYQGSWALPGGFVEYGETVEDAALRETLEETGLLINLKDIVGVYSDINRDPRGHTVSICFHAHPIGGNLTPSTDALEVAYITFDEIFSMELAFDHKKIIHDALNILKKSKIIQNDSSY